MHLLLIYEPNCGATLKNSTKEENANLTPMVRPPHYFLFGVGDIEMSKLLSHPPELSGNLGNLSIRSNLDDFSITVGIKDWQTWHPGTTEIRISENLIHFVQPDGEIVGIKVFGGEN